MVREAQKAGLEFDDEKLKALHCAFEEAENSTTQQGSAIPTIEVGGFDVQFSYEASTDFLSHPQQIDPGSPNPVSNHDGTNGTNGATHAPAPMGFVDDNNFAAHHYTHPDTEFHKRWHFAATKGRIHDVLQFGNGANRMSVISWNIMEYMPFRRMDLQEDGTWKAIIWPLPKGETRDIPANAVVHSSVIKRMLADPTYRPGNLICGGGGRGVRQAPKDMGIGKW
jgi:hypothetical protein